MNASLPVSIPLTLLFALALPAGACGPCAELDDQGRCLATSNADDGDGSLRFVLSQAPSDAAIVFANHIEAITLSSRLDIQKNVTLLYEDPQPLRLTGGEEGVLVIHDIASSVAIENIPFENTPFTPIRAYTDLTIRGGAFLNNGTEANNSAGAIDISGGLHLEDVRFANNTNTYIRSQGGPFLMLDPTTFENSPEARISHTSFAGAPLTLDQRRIPGPVNDSCTIGAWEENSSAPNPSHRFTCQKLRS